VFLFVKDVTFIKNETLVAAENVREYMGGRFFSSSDLYEPLFESLYIYKVLSRNLIEMYISKKLNVEKPNSILKILNHFVEKGILVKYEYCNLEYSSLHFFALSNAALAVCSEHYHGLHSYVNSDYTFLESVSQTLSRLSLNQYHISMYYHNIDMITNSLYFRLESVGAGGKVLVPSCIRFRLNKSTSRDHITLAAFVPEKNDIEKSFLLYCSAIKKYFNHKRYSNYIVFAICATLSDMEQCYMIKYRLENEGLLKINLRFILEEDCINNPLKNVYNCSNAGNGNYTCSSSDFTELF